MQSLKHVFFLSAIFLSHSAFSQDSFYVTVHFPQQLSLKSLTIGYQDGKNNLVYVNVKDYTATVSGPRYARYADIILDYPDSSRKRAWFNNSFWVGAEKAEIDVIPDSTQKNPFTKYRLKNAYSIKAMGQGKLDTFKLAEKRAIDDFMSTIHGGFNDTTQQEIYRLFGKLRNKELQFIRQNPQSYFSFWLFRNDLARSQQMKPDTLLSAYNALFPDSLRQTTEGKEITKLIRARLIAQKGQPAPDYTAQTATGALISPKINAGKYVLLDFWASWCGPCVKLTPKLIEFRSKYDTSKLTVISITLDKNRKDFEEAIASHHMDWTQVFGNQDLIRAYDVTGIPALFLIDPTGKIIYKDGETDENGKWIGDDNNLTQLVSILQEKLGDNK
ncbi:MAG TPA: TlpA disulfide reductase family protein [Puia sp.]|nr:TlpA disulfide reductase family protein [Puia sp.]